MRHPSHIGDIESRLAGNGEPGGGDAPQPILIPILDYIFDHGSITLDVAEQTANVTSERKRIDRLWQDHGGFQGFIRDLMTLIEYRGLAVRQDGAWVPGPEMVEGATVPIVSALKGKPKSGVTHTVFTAEQRAQRNAIAKSQGDFAAAIAKLRPDGPGLRPIDPKNVDDIVKSVREHGLQDHSPILLDDQGRILGGGRHRIAAVKILGMLRPTRVTSTTKPLSTSLSLTISARTGRRKIVRSSRGRGWKGGKVMRLRDGIARLLMENHKRTNLEIVKIAGCGEKTVERVRLELEQRGQIEEWRGNKSRPGESAQELREAIAAVMLSTPGLSQRKIAKIAGCSVATVCRFMAAPTVSCCRKASNETSIPDNIKAALIDNPTLNHAAIARKVGGDARVVARHCANLVAEGVYSVCEHRLLEDGNPVRNAIRGLGKE